jgi:dTDP-4-dehydrorhamnose reductase
VVRDRKQSTVLVTGAGGMLGSALRRLELSGRRVHALGRHDLDVTDVDMVSSVIATHHPDVVVHLAAWTDVDGCQRNPQRAWRVNATGTEHVARACAALGSSLVFVSSLAVFDGTSATAYGETDRPSPANVYGATKLSAERIVQELVPHSFVLRTGWLFSGGAGDHKFVGQMLANARRQEVSVIDDTFGSPTYTGDLAAAIVALVDAGPFGLYHVVNAGEPVTRLDVAREIFALIGSPCRLRPIKIADYPAVAPRPRMEAGTSLRLDEVPAVRLRPWREALRHALASTTGTG